MTEPGKLHLVGGTGSYLPHHTALCGACRDRRLTCHDDSSQFHAIVTALNDGWRRFVDLGWCCPACSEFVSSTR